MNSSKSVDGTDLYHRKKVEDRIDKDWEKCVVNDVRTIKKRRINNVETKFRRPEVVLEVYLVGELENLTDDELIRKYRNDSLPRDLYDTTKSNNSNRSYEDKDVTLIEITVDGVTKYLLDDVHTITNSTLNHIGIENESQMMNSEFFIKKNRFGRVLLSNRNRSNLSFRGVIMEHIYERILPFMPVLIIPAILIYVAEITGQLILGTSLFLSILFSFYLLSTHRVLNNCDKVYMKEIGDEFDSISSDASVSPDFNPISVQVQTKENGTVILQSENHRWTIESQKYGVPGTPFEKLYEEHPEEIDAGIPLTFLVCESEELTWKEIENDSYLISDDKDHALQIRDPQL